MMKQTILTDYFLSSESEADDVIEHYDIQS
jgi:hypothetical protein